MCDGVENFLKTSDEEQLPIQTRLAFSVIRKQGDTTSMYDLSPALDTVRQQWQQWIVASN